MPVAMARGLTEIDWPKETEAMVLSSSLRGTIGRADSASSLGAAS